MNRVACIFVVVLCACGSKEEEAAPEVSSAPNDHKLHRTDTAGGVKIVGAAVPLATLATTEWFMLPMSGDIDVAIDVQHLDDPTKASGSIKISCPANCRLGDDKTVIKPPVKNARNAAFAGEGIRFGHIDFDRFTIVIDVANGKATVSTFDVVSKDVTIKLAGTVELAKPIGDSRVDLCLRFNGTEALTARDYTTSSVLLLTGAPRAADGLFNIKFVDKLGSPKRLGVVCDGSAPPPAQDTPDPFTPDPAASTEPDPEVTKLIASAITKTGDTTFTLDRAKWEKLLENPSAVSKGGRIVPAIKDGKPQGFKLYAIRPDSLADRLGFTNGDTIVSIAGQRLESADKALEVYTKLRDIKAGDRIDVVVERKGAPVTLTYTVK